MKMAHHCRWVVSVACIGMLLLDVDSSQAQMPPPGGSAGYLVTYSSPNAYWTSTGAFGSISGPYTLISGYGANAGTGGSQWGMMPGSATCQGPIIATFTWNNGGDANQLPPPGVVVKEDCSASWSGDFGACNNGLGHPVVSGPISGYASGTKYSFRSDPGATFQVTCSPSASATVYGFLLIGGNANVSYQASASPVDISLSGGAQNGASRKYLIGQQCVAALVCSPLVAQKTASAPAWSITEGEPFGGWNASTASAQVLPVSGLTGELEIRFHFRLPGKSPVVAVSGLLTVPAGALPAQGIPFSVARVVTTQGPIGQLITVTTGDLLDSVRLPGWPLKGVALMPVDYPAVITFGGSPTGNLAKPYGAGVLWKGRAQTPAGYAGGDGGWNFVQTVQMGRWCTCSGPDGTIVYRHVNLNGQWLLDSVLPYAPADDGTNPKPGGISAFPATDQERVEGDSPTEPFLSNMISITIDEHFKTWLMYCPPQPDADHPSTYVPVASVNWFWAGAATKSATGWALTSSDSGHDPAVGSPAHPTWPSPTSTQVYTWVP